MVALGNDRGIFAGDFLFQDVIDLESGRILYHEMLTRFSCGTNPWKKYMRMTTSEFLSVLDKQFAYLASLDMGGPAGVNVFSKCVGDGSVRKLLHEHSNDSGIFLELSEMSSEACSSFQFANELELLKGDGHIIVVDDFGSRFSNIDFVSRYKDLIDYVKIDGKLFVAATENEHDAFLVSAIVSYMQYMDIKIVAEHIEDECAIRFARNIGIEYGQGFGIGKPERFGS